MDRISLKEVEPRLIIKSIAYILLGCWVALGLGVVGVLFKLEMWWPAAVVLLVGFLMLLIPESAKHWLLGVIENYVPGLQGFSTDHILLFWMASCVIFASALKTQAALSKVVFCMITFSIATEMLQYYTSHRNPGVVDGLSSILGILLAVPVFLMIGLVKHSREDGTG